MKIDPQRNYAVLTGDVVNSSILAGERREKLPEVLRESYGELQMSFPGGLPLPLSIYRGDGWQMVVPNPGTALAIALGFRSLFLHRTVPSRQKEKSFDLRVAIGVGEIDFIPDAVVQEGDGAAFRSSGRALEELQAPQRMAFAFPGSPGEEALSVVVELVDALFMGWTPGQALAVAGSLQGLTQQQIGDRWPGRAVRQQTVARHLKRARFETVRSAVALFEKEVG
jgi:hypothetical protein